MAETNQTYTFTPQPQSVFSPENMSNQGKDVPVNTPVSSPSGYEPPEVKPIKQK